MTGYTRLWNRNHQWIPAAAAAFGAALYGGGGGGSHALVIVAAEESKQQVSENEWKIRTTSSQAAAPQRPPPAQVTRRNKNSSPYDVKEEENKTTKRSPTFYTKGDNNPETAKGTSSLKNRLIFLGTGSSTGCPMPRCPMTFGNNNNTTKRNTEYGDEIGGSEDRPNKDDDDDNNNDNNKSDKEFQEYRRLLKDMCRVSNMAIQGGDPRFNRNYRNNPSLVISLTQNHQMTQQQQQQQHEQRAEEDEETSISTKNIIIDVGKTFREASLRWFPIHSIQSLDAVILTHEHADASFGLDDIRGYQKFDLASLKDFEINKANRPIQIPMHVFLSQPCLSDLASRFTWLFPNHQQQQEKVVAQQQQSKQEQDTQESSSSLTITNSNKLVVERHVATLDVTVFEPFVPFVAAGLQVVPLPIMHGEDFVSYGFAFTVGQTNVVYLSDISRMLPETMEYIQTQLPPTDILIVDALRPK